MPVLIDKAVLYSGFLAKYRAAFLRNTSSLQQRESEFRRPSMQLLDDALAVLLFVVRSTRVLIVDAEAHGVVEQDSDLARGRRHRFGLLDARGQASVEGAQRGVGT